MPKIATTNADIINAAETTEVQIIADVIRELYRTRKKFPSPDHVTLAMVEELGELADELKKPNPDPSAIYREAVQSMAMIIRNITEHDAYREENDTYSRLQTLSRAGDEAREVLDARPPAQERCPE